MVFGCCPRKRLKEDDVQAPLNGQLDTSALPSDSRCSTRGSSVPLSNVFGDDEDCCEPAGSTSSQNKGDGECDQEELFIIPLNEQEKPCADPAPISQSVSASENVLVTSSTPTGNVSDISNSNVAVLSDGIEYVEYDVQGRPGKSRNGMSCDNAYPALTIRELRIASVSSRNSLRNAKVECGSSETAASVGEEFVERDVQGRFGEPLIGRLCTGTNPSTSSQNKDLSENCLLPSSDPVSNVKKSGGSVQSSTAELRSAGKDIPCDSKSKCEEANIIVSSTNDEVSNVSGIQAEEGTSRVIESSLTDTRNLTGETTISKGSVDDSQSAENLDKDAISSHPSSFVQSGPNSSSPCTAQSLPADDVIIESKESGIEAICSVADFRVLRFKFARLNTGFVSESSIPVAYSSSIHSESSNSLSFHDVPNATVDGHTGELRMPDPKCIGSASDRIRAVMKEDGSGPLSNVSSPSDSKSEVNGEPAGIDLGGLKNKSIVRRKSLLSPCLASSCSSENELQEVDDETSVVTCASLLMSKFREWFRRMPSSVGVIEENIEGEVQSEIDLPVCMYESLSLMSEAGRFPDREVNRNRRLGEVFIMSRRVSRRPFMLTTFIFGPESQIKVVIPRKNLCPSRLKHTNRNSMTSYRVYDCKLSALRHRVPQLPCSPDCMCQKVLSNPLPT